MSDSSVIGALESDQTILLDVFQFADFTCPIA
jgi:hypothetical protein